MGHLLSEKEVLKKLKIEDFRHLTKDKVVELASCIDKMDPEVAKKALEQFPEFAKTAKEFVVQYREEISKVIKSADDSTKSVYHQYDMNLASLRKMLEKPNLSAEERMYIIEQMCYLTEKIDIKDDKHKNWLAGMAAIASVTVMGSVAILASVLGGKVNIDLGKIIGKKL